MFALLLSILFRLFSAPAHAQVPGDWSYETNPVLEPDPLKPYMATSVGSPAVVYDSIRGRWFMLFETKTATVDANCPQGVWGIGAAVSADGINWTPYASALLNPVPSGTRFWNCAASHPTAVFLPNGNGQIIAFFKAEQADDACSVVAPSWGCNVKVGFGRAQIFLNASGDPSVIGLSGTPVHVPTTTNFGFPKVVKVGNLYRILYQAYPDIVSTSSALLTSFPAATLEIDLVNGEKYGTTYAIDEWFNPAFVCDDDPTFEYATFVGARNTNAGTVIEGAWGKAIRDVWTGGSFALDLTPQVTWSTDDEWRHWDVTRLSTDEYLVWFDEKDGSGNNFIRFGGTDLAFNNSDAVSKVCP
jgi:hypothetical protein